MPKYRSLDYKTPACESGVGNVSWDKMTYVITGNEAAGDVVVLRRMKGRSNTYLRMNVVNSAALAALSTVDVGYDGLDGQADVQNAFGDDVDMTATQTDLLTAPVAVDGAHEIVLLLNTDISADAGKTITVFAEFVNVSG